MDRSGPTIPRFTSARTKRARRDAITKDVTTIRSSFTAEATAASTSLEAAT